MPPIGPEIVIRTTAIRGLGNLAERDDVAAGALAALAEYREPALQEQASGRGSLAIASSVARLGQPQNRQRLDEGRALVVQRLVGLAVGSDEGRDRFAARARRASSDAW